MLTPHLSMSEGFFTVPLYTHTHAHTHYHQSMKYCANHEDVNSSNSSLLDSRFSLATLDCDFPDCSLSCPFPAKQLEWAFTERTWTSMALYPVAQRASILLYLLCKRCDVPQPPRFTEQSIYWRRFKIHYRLVLPRKIVEQHSEIGVRTGLLQEKT